MEFYTQEKRRDTNRSAEVHARGWSGLMNGFGGSSSDKIEPWMLMPYPREAKQQRRKLRDRTVRVLVKLLSSGKLPTRIEGVIRGFEEVSDLVSEDED